MRVPRNFRYKSIRKLPIVLVITLSIIPILMVVNEIRSNNINLPYWDEWDQSVPLALNAANGNFRLKDIIDQHNEHRTLTANIVTVFLTWASNWDIRLSHYISFFITLINLGLIIDLFRRYQPERVILIIIPSTFLLFSMRQKSNWLWAFQTQWFFIVFYLIAALWILNAYKVGWRPIIIAAIFAFLSTFSLLSGIILWPVLAITFWLLGYKRKRYLLFWTVATFLVIGLFFYEYDFYSIGQDEVTTFLFRPTVIASYCLIFIGNLFAASDPILSMRIGFGGIVLLLLNTIIYLKRRATIEPIIIWLAFAGYSVGAGLLTAFGRARIFLAFESQPLSSRYVTISTPFWIGLLAIIILNSFSSTSRVKRSRGEVSFMVINMAILVGLSGLYFQANKQMKAQPTFLTQSHEECVFSYPVSQHDDCLDGLYPDRKMILERVLQLSQSGLLVFADKSHSAVLPLALVPIELVDSQTLNQFQSQLIDGKEETVLFQQSLSTHEQKIVIPNILSPVVLKFGVYSKFGENPTENAVPSEKVEFILHILSDADEELLLIQTVFDLTHDRDPSLVTADLEKFKGQRVKLVYEVRNAESDSPYLAMWVNPTIELGNIN